jgi:hypothetical protein
MSGVVIGCLIVASLALLWLEHAARRAPTEPAPRPGLWLPPEIPETPAPARVEVCDREGNVTSVYWPSADMDLHFVLLIALETEGTILRERERRTA